VVHNPLVLAQPFFFLNLGFLFCPGNVKTRHRSVMYAYFPLPSDLHWGTAPILWRLGPIRITVKDLLFTITSSVTNQPGGYVVCSLRQTTWSINKNTEFSLEWKWLENTVLEAHYQSKVMARFHYQKYNQ
jgi:hypothetical protein